MKNLLLTFLLMIVVGGMFSCRKRGELPASAKLDAQLFKDTTRIEFVDSVTFNFDTITEGEKVEHNFTIKNAGDKNLIIARAYGSCGCTVPEYPKDPVKPGASATIHVTFNSAGKLNEQAKTVTLVCNTPLHNEVLFVKGFVKAKN